MALSVMYGENCFRLIPKHWTIESKYLKQRRDHIDGDDSDDNDRDDNDRDDDDSDDDYLEDWEQEYVSVFLVLKRMPVDF